MTRRPPPYLQRVPVKGSTHAVWLVDDEWVRQNLNPEFCNYGQHYRFPFIPRDEFWIAAASARQLTAELGYFLVHLDEEFAGMERGLDYGDALTRADRLEAKVRRQRPARPVRSVHERRWGETADGLVVWLVNSQRVREQHHDLRFAAGGHPLVYDYVPNGEIWIDSSLRGRVARELCLLHELFEYHLMGRGIQYDEAHEQAIQVEAHARAYPEKRAALLARELAGDDGRHPMADGRSDATARGRASAGLNVKAAGAGVRAGVGSGRPSAIGHQPSTHSRRARVSVTNRARTRGRSA
jgi:hypothetical protein